MAYPTYENGYIKNKRAIKLFYQVWQVPQPVMNVIVVHGVGEHSGRYEEFAHFLASKNISVYAFDLHGYGKSAGKRGHVRRFTDYADDVATFTEFVHSRYAGDGKKFFLLAHSLGAIISIIALHRSTANLGCAGLVISGPPFKLCFSLPSWLHKVEALLSSFFPALTVQEKRIELNMLTHDTEKIEAFRKDPYRHYKRSLRFITEYFKGEKAAYAAAHELAIPILILQGAADTVIDVAKVKDFYHALTEPDKTLIVYPEMYHEVLNELERERVYSDVLGWLMMRVLDDTHELETQT